MKSKIYLAYLLCLSVVILLTGCASKPDKAAVTQVVPLSENQTSLKNSEKWLKNNLSNSGVVQTESGLQYKIIEHTAGCHIDATKNVTVHYVSVLAENNQVFDSSYKRGVPAKFQLNKVISAWQEGVSLMKVGETWVFYVHPELAYGEKGSLPVIKPNVVTLYKVELIDATCKK